MPEEYEGPEGPDNLDEPPAFFPNEGSARRGDAGDQGDLIEVQIEGIFRAESGNQISQFVLVADGERKLPIMIGGFESQAIVTVLEGQRPPRPMTHDLIRKILDRLDTVVDRVVIDDFWNDVYYAKLYLRHGSEEIEIDSRPSDAIAMAVRFEAPIYVADAILDASSQE